MKIQTFLTAEWRNLLMLNYEVSPEVLAPLLPPATELDLWQGKALVSMVGFQFLETRVLGIKWPWHVNFEEVNLRFYVRHFDGQVWKRGTVFVSEIVPRPIITVVANTLYNERYKAMPMRHSIQPVDADNRLYAMSGNTKAAGMRWELLLAIPGTVWSLTVPKPLFLSITGVIISWTNIRPMSIRWSICPGR